MSADVAANENGSSTTPLSEQRRRSAQRAWRYSGILVPLSFAVLMFGVLAVALNLHQGHGPNPNPIPTPEPEPTDDSILINRELRRATFDIELAQAKQAMRHLESARAEWSKLLESTLHDTAGKRIGGNEEMLLRFIALRRTASSPPKEPTAAEFANQLNAIAQKAHVQDIDSDALDRLTAAVADMEQQAYDAYRFHQACVEHLHALRQSASSLPAGDVELSAAVSMRDATLTRRVNSAAEVTRREVEESLSEELEQLKKERDHAASLVADLKSQLARVEKGESLTTPTENGVPVPLASRQDYEKELERIRTDLVAFTTPGYVQPETADKLVYHTTEQPVSFSALRRVGALDDSENGRAILLRVGGSKSATQQNDRPLGNFPRMTSVEQLRKDEDVKARVRNAQRLLKRYGSLMVEDGLLAP